MTYVAPSCEETCETCDRMRIGRSVSVPSAFAFRSGISIDRSAGVTNRTGYVFATLMLVAFMTPSDLASQTDSTAAPVPGFCWRARQLPRCASFPITDFAVTTALITTRSDPDQTFGSGNYPDFQHAMRWTVGLMRNRSARRAQGVTIGLTIDGGGDSSPSLEWRERFWDSRTRGFLDLGGGYTNKDVFIRRVSQTQSSTTTAHGLTASAVIAPVDLIGLLARTDVVFSGEGAHVGLSVGAQTGSYGTLIVGALMAAYVAVILVALGAGY
jgi:hypothetical protein